MERQAQAAAVEMINELDGYLTNYQCAGYTWLQPLLDGIQLYLCLMTVGIDS